MFKPESRVNRNALKNLIFRHHRAPWVDFCNKTHICTKRMHLYHHRFSYPAVRIMSTCQILFPFWFSVHLQKQCGCRNSYVRERYCQSNIIYLSWKIQSDVRNYSLPKVKIFWEGHKIWENITFWQY